MKQGPTEFRLEVSRASETVILFVHGEVDLATAPMLDHALRDLIWDQGNLRVVLDLREVTFIDSTGLRLFLQASDAMATIGGEFALRAPSDRVMKLLHLTGLDRKILIIRTRDLSTGCAQAADRDWRARA